jgi:hypothetical protein
MARFSGNDIRTIRWAVEFGLAPAFEMRGTHPYSLPLGLDDINGKVNWIFLSNPVCLKRLEL